MENQVLIGCGWACYNKNAILHYINDQSVILCKIECLYNKIGTARDLVVEPFWRYDEVLHPLRCHFCIYAFL